MRVAGTPLRKPGVAGGVGEEAAVLEAVGIPSGPGGRTRGRLRTSAFARDLSPGTISRKAVVWQPLGWWTRCRGDKARQ